MGRYGLKLSLKFRQRRPIRLKRISRVRSYFDLTTSQDRRAPLKTFWENKKPLKTCYMFYLNSLLHSPSISIFGPKYFQIPLAFIPPLMRDHVSEQYSPIGNIIA